MKFKVGDRVRIRQWDDMEKEFGLDSVGDINCSGYFTKAMRPLCGKKAIITYIDGEWIVLDKFENCEGINHNHIYTTDMIEHVEDDTEIVISKHGKEVRAVFKVNGKVVKESVAKCHPDDRFNFKTGAEIAFSRLFEKKKKRITFRDMLENEYTEFVGKVYDGEYFGCPFKYGYEERSDSPCFKKHISCLDCWNREYIPQEKKK